MPDNQIAIPPEDEITKLRRERDEALTSAKRARSQYRCYACKQVFDEDDGHGLARQHFGDVFRNPLPKCCEVIDGTARWGGGPHDPFLRVRKDHYDEMENNITAANARIAELEAALTRVSGAPVPDPRDAHAPKSG